MDIELNGTPYERYNDLNDNELLAFVRNGDTEALDCLMIRYKNLARKKAKTMYLLGGDHEDTLQEAMIGLYKAIRDYKGERNTSFVTFAEMCIQRQIYTAIKKANTKKNRPLNDYISIDIVYDKNGNESENHKMERKLNSNYSPNPEEYIIGKENADTLEARLNAKLSLFERKVLYFYLQNMDKRGIAEQVEKDQKSVINALSRIKKKLKVVLKIT